MNPPGRPPFRSGDEPGRTDPVPVLDAQGAVEALRTARRIAIVGASAHRWRASNSVMGYLLRAGYECVPVTPRATEVLGQRCWATLEEAAAGTGGPFDIVDVFRRAEHTPEIARAAVAASCRTLWLQQGIVNWEAARIAHDGGLTVVMDRCTAVDHRQVPSSGG